MRLQGRLWHLPVKLRPCSFFHCIQKINFEGDYNMSKENMDQYVINVMKGLIIDGVSKANSGHPGGAMSSSDFAYIVFRDYLTFNPSNPTWFNRDRFVLSAGHESMLLYSLLVLQGFMDKEELKKFRQWGSHTPGHPEIDRKHGIENTSGPLGQGVGMAVGFAVAEAHLNARLGADIADHYTYVLAGDGDVQEPVALGAAQLAGHFKLNKLIMYYDNNRIQISGHTDRADSTDIAKMFESFQWRVVEIDGHDHAAMRREIDAAKTQTEKPTIIIGKTVMSKGSTKYEDMHDFHGAPFPADEVVAIKKTFGLPENDTFFLPEDALAHFRARYEDLKKEAADWEKKKDAKLSADSSFKTLWEALHKASFDGLTVPEFAPGEKVATRVAFGKVLADFYEQVPFLVGGSADLEPSNNTGAFAKKTTDFAPATRAGRNFAFGVREFPMGVLINGIALHSGLRSFGATFLVFSDYERGSLRLSALMEIPVLHVFTHDSFYLGEDGPTHQPIEHLISLRAIPNMVVMRPAEATETAAAMQYAMSETKSPICLILTRQGLPTLDRTKVAPADSVRKGAYIVKGSESETPDIILMASGSEVTLALNVAEKLPGKVRVVSMPSLELFERQSQDYKDKVLPPAVEKRVSIEAGSTIGWGRYVGLKGIAFGIDHFGASAPAEVLEEKFGFTTENLVKVVKEKFGL